jgi:hypothetical protein
MTTVFSSAAIVAAVALSTMAHAGFPAPSGVSATDDLCGEVLVTWNPVPGAISYKVYSGGINTQTVDCTGAVGSIVGETTETSFSVVENDTILHCYTVRAIFRDGQSSQSAADAGQALQPPQIDVLTLSAGGCIGGSATFKVAASGYDVIEWYKNGELLAAGVEQVTITNLTPEDDGAIISVYSVNACGTTRPTPATLFVLAEPTRGPIDVTGSTRSISAMVYKTGCGGAAEECSNTDETFGACEAPFDASLALEPPCATFGPESIVVQDSTISGHKLAASGTADGDSGGTCSMVFHDEYHGTSLYSVQFSLAKDAPYVIDGLISAVCMSGFGNCCSDPSASLKLVSASNESILSFAIGGSLDELGEVPIAAKGMLAAGSYTLTAEATSGGLTGAFFCQSAGPGHYEFTFSVDPIEGDLNGDGVVDGADLGLLLAAWGSCNGCPEDLNDDGEVDGADLGVLLGSWTG